MYSWIGSCPGFDQERLNFHQKPGGDTACQADPNLSNRTGYSIACATMPGSRGRELGGGKAVTAQEHAQHQAVRVALCISLFDLYILLICIVVVTVHCVCCPYPDPQDFCFFFFPFSSPPQWGEG